MSRRVVELVGALGVRALGQIELLFAFLVTLVVFREKVSIGELLGAGAVVFGLMLLLI